MDPNSSTTHQMSSKKWTKQSIPSQAGRVAVVTGGNSGIGLETAKALAENGAEVVLACRSVERGKEAARRIKEACDGSVSHMTLDLASLASVREFGTAFSSAWARLDLLINNAGVMMLPGGRTEDGFELQLGVNHLGHFALTGGLLEILLGTRGSRIVTVSSKVHESGAIDFEDLNWEKRQYRAFAAYSASKLANALFTAELTRRLDRAGATTISMAAHPGWTGTNLLKHMWLPNLANQLIPMKPWKGALPTLMAATADDVQNGDYFGPGGLFEIMGYPKKVEMSEVASDPEIAARLFEVSKELTGTRFDLID